MNQIIFSDTSCFEIDDGASINYIRIIVSDFSELKEVSDVLLIEDNFKRIQFCIDNEIVGTYTNMKLVKPLFKSVEINSDKKVIATIEIREKTETELAIEELQSRTSALEEIIS